jgi:hypothetical protein
MHTAMINIASSLFIISMSGQYVVVVAYSAYATIFLTKAHETSAIGK